MAFASSGPTDVRRITAPSSPPPEVRSYFVGRLAFQDDYPTAETIERLYDELDFQGGSRATWRWRSAMRRARRTGRLPKGSMRMQNLNTVYELIRMEESNPTDGTGASWHYSVTHDDELFSVDISHRARDDSYRTRVLWNLCDSRAEVLSEEDSSYDSFYFALMDSIAWIWNWCMEIPEQDGAMANADRIYVYPTKLTMSIVTDKH